MKKVLLLGDSIRMGYADDIKKLLDGKAEVYYSEDNGRFAAYTLWQANQMFKTYGKFDVVHWNNGYWDMNIEAPMSEAIHPIDEYVHFLKRIINLIRQNGAKIIFATTTPVLDDGCALDNTGTDKQINYSNDWVCAYNKAATEVMVNERIFVNDLYTLALTDDNYFKCEDKLHLTSEGSCACAKQAVSLIESLL